MALKTLLVPQAVNKLPIIYGMEKIVTVSTRGRYLSLFLTQRVQFTPWSQNTVFPVEPVVKVQRGCRSVAMSSMNFVARWVGWSRPRPDHFPLGEDPTILIAEEAGWAPWPGWRDVEKGNSLVPTWVRTLNRSDSSKSLYRLRYPGSKFLENCPHSCLGLSTCRRPVNFRSKILYEKFFSPFRTLSYYHLLYSTR